MSALSIHSRVVQSQLSTNIGGRGEITVFTSDNKSATVVHSKVGAGSPTTRVIPISGLVHELLSALPEIPGDPKLHPRRPVVLPEQFTVSISRAIKGGDSAMVSAIVGECGWTEVPPLLNSVVTEVVGTSQLVIGNSVDSTLTYATLLLIPTGWVELLPGANEVVRHVPRTIKQLGVQFTSGLTGAYERLARHDR